MNKLTSSLAIIITSMLVANASIASSNTTTKTDSHKSTAQNPTSQEK